MTDLPAPQRPRPRPSPRTLPRFATLRAITALILREMSTTYGRSPGGYLWAVLEPVAGIALLTGIFSIGFRSPALGISFAMFYATGMLPYLMFADIAGKLAQTLNYSRQLLIYPRVTFVDALVARFILNMMTQLLVNYIVLGGILLLFETRVVMDGLTILKAYGLAGLLALGIGTWNSYMTVRFPVYQRIWSIAMRPLFLLSCIFFIFDTIPQPYSDYVWFNPLVHIVGLMRRGFYPNYDAPYVSEPYVLVVALVSMVLGLMLLRRDHKMLLEM
ncbi:ABC transporter permease [Sagittula sp. NFXS13]|uniref:ABC transporter permease n=1 Tax=Sagittula sp. NFXS13 TaxID=2819095 RepID=UPI0032DF9C88